MNTTSGQNESVVVEDEGYCTKKLTDHQRPSHLEILLPPLLLLLLLPIGLSILVVSNKMSLWKQRRRGAPYRAHNHVMPTSRLLHDDKPCLVDPIFDTSPNLYDEFDMEVLRSINTHVNTPRQVLAICVPAIVSLALSTLLLLLKDAIFRCMWPAVEVPSINVAVTCFLAPAGLIYALSFGFTFSSSIDKTRSVLDKITTELSDMDQMATMVSKFSLASKKHEMAMYRAIKCEVVFMAMLVQNREPSSYRTNRKGNRVKVGVWSLIDILRDAADHPESNFNLNTILVDRLVSYLLKLNSICSDRIGILHSCIHPLKWAFLELLGTMTLLGVMMIDAKSSRMEIAMSELTAFSMAMLCFVLADLDSPFNGFFRVGTEVLADVAARVESMYDQARYMDGRSEEAGTPVMPVIKRLEKK